jgi:uracil-DNA glycosylase family 4
MSSDLINPEDPEDWIQSQKSDQFESFVEDEVVGSHCSSCQFTPDPVVKIGSLEADLMVVGEFPTGDDHQNDRPFSGDLGTLLQRMMEAIDRDLREDCYLTNAVLCGGHDEDVRQRSVEACSVNLHRQVELVSPSVVFILGRLGYCSLYKESVEGDPTEVLGHQGPLPECPWVEGVVSLNPIHLLNCESGSDQEQKLKSLLWDHLRTVDGHLEETSANDEMEGEPSADPEPPEE